MDTFKGLALAYTAMEKGGNIPTIYNAANEAAVARFLNREIAYLEIPEIIEAAMSEVAFVANPSLDEVLQTEQATYDFIDRRWERHL